MVKTFYGFRCVERALQAVEAVLPPDEFKIKKAIVTEINEGRVMITCFYGEREN